MSWILVRSPSLILSLVARLASAACSRVRLAAEPLPQSLLGPRKLSALVARLLAHVELSPLHTRHASSCLGPPHAPAQSCRQSFTALASHTPQWSDWLRPHGHCAQSRQLFCPAQTPQRSAARAPPHTPPQSCRQSLAAMGSHTPHLSLLLLPDGVPAQSVQAPAPPHTPQRSAFFVPPHAPLQSTLQSFWVCHRMRCAC